MHDDPRRVHNDESDDELLLLVYACMQAGRAGRQAGKRGSSP
jgi:hypothetical protein